jgi:hypothetical protein
MRKFHPHQQITGLSGLTLEDFWIWAFSDLLANTVRNSFAEFMVGFALGRLNTPRPGQEAGNFIYREKRVEVRAAAYTQSQPQKKKSKINFDINIRKDQTAQKPAIPGKLRGSDCYVFSLFTFDDFDNKEAARNALIDTTYWNFYVMKTAKIDELLKRQKTVGVTWLSTNCTDGPTHFTDLKRQIDKILGFPS